jgi:alpha-ketoglutarate-dependent 2,4-dichlorophenoxyacetate dioxygenase
MTVSIGELQPGFASIVEGIDLRRPCSADEVAAIERGIDVSPVLIFRGQMIDDEQQMVFSRNFGELQRATYTKNPENYRLGSAMTDSSNLGKDNQPLQPGDRRRMNNLGSRRWHTDGSFRRVPGKYSLLSGRVIPSSGGETQFADMRAGYDALPEGLKATIDELIVEHNLIHSREKVGYTGFSEDERAALPPVRQPLVRRHPRTGRKSLYLSSHASHIVGWPLPEGLDLLHELTEIATQPQFVYTHRWQVGDLVMWDNRVTMHRARRHFPETAPRDLRRTTIEDVAPTLEQAA